MNTHQQLGSRTAKNGFLNEKEVIKRFNNWKSEPIAQEWLTIMGYQILDIEYVKAIQLSGSKTDIQVQVSICIKLKSALDVQNLQVKLVSNPRGFNQIDKRWVDKYVEMWNIPDEITVILKHYTGEYPPFIVCPKDSRRMFMNEFPKAQQDLLINWIKGNKILITTDILKGRGKLAAEWMLVIQRTSLNAKWALLPINVCMNYFSNGDVYITPRGSIKIGKITMQRKGGDGGRATAQMLQFKINPAEIIDL